MVSRKERIAALRKEFSLKKSTPVIGMVGRLEKEKNPGLLVDALSDLVEEYPDLKCMFVGEGPLKNDLIRRVRELHLDRAVIFTGYRSDALQLTALMDVLILPSWTEGIPKSLLEGLAFKTPVVATAVGGGSRCHHRWREWVSHTPR